MADEPSAASAADALLDPVLGAPMTAAAPRITDAPSEIPDNGLVTSEPAHHEDDILAPSSSNSLDVGQRSVIVPPLGGTAEDNRLPIFESVESDWFRSAPRTRRGIGSRASSAGSKMPVRQRVTVRQKGKKVPNDSS
jgi:hypothetical protein